MLKPQLENDFISKLEFTLPIIMNGSLLFGK
jgi:hypothetical protein